MAVEITGKYIGHLKTELTHGPSGTVIRTAAPVDNQGDGSSFSPTDLAAASLGFGPIELFNMPEAEREVPKVALR